MKIILFTVLGGLLLLWAGIGALLKWIPTIERKHLLWLGGYASLVTVVLLFLVIHTARTQQEAALSKTSTLLSEQVDNFRLRLGEITERLMGQIEEKAELTQSEMEIRGNLKQERAEHELTRERLAETIEELKATAALREKQEQAHYAYRDSLNTERSLHAETRQQFQQEKQELVATRQELTATRETLGQVQERAESLAADVTRLRKSVQTAEARADRAEENQEKLLARFNQTESQLGQHTESLVRLQAMIDSLYEEKFDRAYSAPGTSPASK